MTPAARTDSRWWLYCAAGLLLVTLQFAMFIVFGAAPAIALRGAVANLLPAALLGVLVFRLPRHLPWPEESARQNERSAARFFAAHGAVLLAFLALSTCGWIALVTLDHALFAPGGPRFDIRFMPFRLLCDFLIYLTVAGLAYAWDNARRSAELAERAARSDALRARAELEAMRSQLNPHFILNTFHALVGLVRRDPALAEEALERLGDLLRHSLRVQRESLDEIRLADELALVSSYLDLERLRLGDRLRVRIDADPSAEHCLVPSFAVQTLVENSIRHAIAPRAAGGSLAIVTSREEGRLRIAVEDDGTGAAPPQNGNGVGLRLLRERLAALYDRHAVLAFEPSSGRLRAVLELPARESREDS